MEWALHWVSQAGLMAHPGASEPAPLLQDLIRPNRVANVEKPRQNMHSESRVGQAAKHWAEQLTGPVAAAGLDARLTLLESCLRRCLLGCVRPLFALGAYPLSCSRMPWGATLVAESAEENAELWQLLPAEPEEQQQQQWAGHGLSARRRQQRESAPPR